MGNFDWVEIKSKQKKSNGFASCDCQEAVHLHPVYVTFIDKSKFKFITSIVLLETISNGNVLFYRYQGYIYTYRVSQTETGSWSAEVHLIYFCFFGYQQSA